MTKKPKEKTEGEESIIDPGVVGTNEITFFDVELTGARDILFDKFFDHSKEVRPAERKIYMIPGNIVVLPAENLLSFFVREMKPFGIIKTVEGKQAGIYIRIAWSTIGISPTYIPFLNDQGEKIIYKEMWKDGFYVFEQSGITKQANGQIIKQPAQPRAGLSMPWKLQLTLSLRKNSLIDEPKLRSWLEAGGRIVGLCNYRPRFGQFEVTKWEKRS